jgi:hypothetical protein
LEVTLISIKDRLRGYGRINQAFSEQFEVGECAYFIPAHEAPIACDVCRQHRRQSPFDLLAGQRTSLKLVIFPSASKHIGPLLD